MHRHVMTTTSEKRRQTHQGRDPRRTRRESWHDRNPLWAKNCAVCYLRNLENFAPATPTLESERRGGYKLWFDPPCPQTSAAGRDENTLHRRGSDAAVELRPEGVGLLQSSAGTGSGIATAGVDSLLYHLLRSPPHHPAPFRPTLRQNCFGVLIIRCYKLGSSRVCRPPLFPDVVV